jgi:hypothetical protein
MEFDWTRILKGQDAPPEPRTPPPPERRARPRPREFPRAVAPYSPEPAAAPHIPTPELPPDFVAEAVETAAEVATENALADVPRASSMEVTAAAARLGAEGLARLRSRHSEVLARISEKTVDPVRREQLKSEAERLNPDTWVTDAEVVAGLEAYETVFESLRGVIGRRRKRRRRRSGGGGDDRPGAVTSNGPAGPADSSAPERTMTTKRIRKTTDDLSI